MRWLGHGSRLQTIITFKFIRVERAVKAIMHLILLRISVWHAGPNAYWPSLGLTTLSFDSYGNSNEKVWTRTYYSSDSNGCLDTDGDSWSDSVDLFSTDPTEWADNDSDGFGDNSDACPDTYSQGKA